MKLLESVTDNLGRPGAAGAGQIRRNRRLPTRHQISQLLLSKAGLDQIRGDFLGVHEHTISRSCFIRQHQRDYNLYYIRDMRTLAERLIWAREQKQLTQEGLAKLVGVSQSTIGNLEAGIRKTTRSILEIAKALDVDPMWLQNGTGVAVASPASSPPSNAQPVPERQPPYLVHSQAKEPAAEDNPFVIRGPSIFVGEEPDTIKVQRVQIRLRAGFTGYETVPEYEDGGYLAIPQKVIEQLQVDPQFLVATRAHGCSMEPMIFDNEWVVVNTVDRKPVDRKIFAVNFNGEACIKQLLLEGGQWYLHSLNPDFDRVNVKSGQSEIIGRVVYQPGRVVSGA